MSTDTAAETELDATQLDGIHRVELADDECDIRPPEPGTIVDRLREQECEIIVTFDPDIADSYPSIRFLQPGDPLYSKIVMLGDRVGEVALDWEYLGTGDEDSVVCSFGETPPVVQGPVDSEGRMLHLSDEGLIQESDSNGFNFSDYCMLYQDWSKRE